MNQGYMSVILLKEHEAIFARAMGGGYIDAMDRVNVNDEGQFIPSMSKDYTRIPSLEDFFDEIDYKSIPGCIKADMTDFDHQYFQNLWIAAEDGCIFYGSYGDVNPYHAQLFACIGRKMLTVLFDDDEGDILIPFDVNEMAVNSEYINNAKNYLSAKQTIDKIINNRKQL